MKKATKIEFLISEIIKEKKVRKNEEKKNKKTDYPFFKFIELLELDRNKTKRNKTKNG